MLGGAHTAVTAIEGLPGLPGDIEGVQIIASRSELHAARGLIGTLVGIPHDLDLQEDAVQEEALTALRETGHDALCHLIELLITLRRLLRGLEEPLRLTGEVLRVRAVQEVLTPLRRMLHVLGYQHTGHAVRELFTRMIIRMLTVLDRRLPEALVEVLDVVAEGLAIVLPYILLQMLLRPCQHLPLTAPDGGDVVEVIDMRLDVRGIDHPEVAGARHQDLRELGSHQLRCIREHRQHRTRLQIIEGGVVVDTMMSLLPLLRKRIDSRVAVPLTTADHATIAIVRPDEDDVLRQLQAALLVELHHLTVEVRTADRLLHHRILLHDHIAQQLSALLIRIIGRIVIPEGVVALSAEAEGPDDLHPLLAIDRLLPELPEQCMVLENRRPYIRVRAGKHLGTERLCVVVRDIEAHIGGQTVIDPASRSCIDI